jgi:ATP-dependent DNA helicase RecG
LEKTNDGFKISEEDMRLRGPGQFLGTMQSGIPDVTMETLSDVRTIQATRMSAQRILTSDPYLEKLPELKKQVGKLESSLHLE